MCLEDAVEDRVLDTFEIASAEIRVRQRVLRVHVFAAAAFEHQLDLDVRLAPLMKVKDGRAGARVVAGVLAGDAVDAVLSQVPFFRRDAHGVDCDLFELQLVVADWCVDVEEDRAGVLAKRERAFFCEADVAADHVQRDVRVRAFHFLAARRPDGANDVVRQLRRGAPDQLEDRFKECAFRRGIVNRGGCGHRVLRRSSVSPAEECGQLRWTAAEPGGFFTRWNAIPAECQLDSIDGTDERCFSKS